MTRERPLAIEAEGTAQLEQIICPVTMNAMDVARREEERFGQMLTSALRDHLARASGEDWVWRGAPSAPLRLAYQEPFF